MQIEPAGRPRASYMFEASEGNGRLIREFRHAASHPRATSLSAAVYRLMPNYTDMNVFKEAGMVGLNFAFVDGVENYHRATDTPENLDRRSLQHHQSHT